MNPEAIKWLESLGDEHPKYFSPMYPFDGSFASIKNDHEYQSSSGFCFHCSQCSNLVVVE